MSAPGKRRIGGHFGAALGASTKRQRAGWRDEVEEDDVAANTQAGDDDDSEEAVLDPGTPLPSEEEEEAEKAASPEKVETAEDMAKVAEAEDDKAQTAITAVNEEKAPATTAGEANMPAAFNLEVIVGKNKVGELRILLPFGVDSDIEQRLSACVAPDGGSVDFIVGQTVCGFGGHAVPGQKETDKGPEEGETQEMAAGLLPVEAPKAPEPVANGFQSAGLHCCAGLLTAPRCGTGLALTLGADSALDSTHRVLGPVLSGRRCFRRLQALAPLSLEARPRVPVFLQLPKQEEEGVGGHGRQAPLRLEPYKESAAPPFAEEEEKAVLPPEELLDLVDLELSGRDGEVADLKQTTFSRERQQGVDKVEEVLHSLLARVEKLEGLDETLSGQRVWVEEGANRLLRVLKKLH
ncbi:unnamed protein product [Durusdinium trenchii]|uniref:Peptidylprolyl isomerase n=1 Tax=Durusdinium trenchii TaxID=1381693 RepID=A0ABP0HN18_9DINO